MDEKIKRKHELLKKQYNEELTKLEFDELLVLEQEIEKDTEIRLNEATKRMEEKGKYKVTDTKQEQPIKQKMTISERKQKAEEIINEMKGQEQKIIIKKIRDELGVSYTWVYKIINKI